MSRYKRPRYLRNGKHARVRINGKLYPLGRYGSPESKEKYERLLAEEWVAPDAGPPAEHWQITITELAVIYIKHAKQHYRKNGEPTSEIYSARTAIRRLRAIYGSSKAADFGPLKLQAFRESMIVEYLARTTINHYVFHVVRMFKHSAKFEIVPFEWYNRLTVVGTLQENRTNARETNDVLPIDDKIVNKTVKKLPNDTLKAMVRLHRITGLRSSELCQVRPCDIDRSNKHVWFYRPRVHKNQHRKTQRAKERVIVLGKQAQKVLLPYLLRDHQTFCFVPPTGGKPCYTKDSYRRSICRAAKRAKVPHWFPNQLRHTWATECRKHGGLETTQQGLGHTQRKTTERYAEIDVSLMIEYARKYG